MKSTKVHRARKRDKRRKDWGNPIIDKLMQLKYSINDAYNHRTESTGDTQDDKNYVMSLISDVRKNGLIKLSHEDGLKCNDLWRKYGG